MKVKTKDGRWHKVATGTIYKGHTPGKPYIGCLTSYFGFHLRDRWYDSGSPSEVTIECGDEEFELEVMMLRMK